MATGEWYKLNERAIMRAIGMQARALAEIHRAYGPPTEQTEQQALTMEAVLDEAERCGHRWGVPDCNCVLCGYVGGSFDIVIPQLLASLQGGQ